MSRSWKASRTSAAGGGAADTILRPQQRTRRRWPLALTAALVIAGVQFLTQFGIANPASAWAPGWTRVTKVASGGSPVSRTVIAKCPAGKWIIGGGGAVDDDRVRRMVLTELIPVHSSTGDYFQVSAAEPPTGLDIDWSLTAYATCANPLSGWERQVGTSPPGSSATFQATYAQCTPGKVVVGTGAAVSSALNGQVGLHLVRSDSGLTIGRAAAREEPNGYGSLWTVSAFTICANSIQQQLRWQLSYTNTVPVACPQGLLVHGAGGGGGLSDSGASYLQAIVPRGSPERVTVTMTDPLPVGIVAHAICA